MCDIFTVEYKPFRVELGGEAVWLMAESEEDAISRATHNEILEPTVVQEAIAA